MFSRDSTPPLPDRVAAPRRTLAAPGVVNHPSGLDDIQEAEDQQHADDFGIAGHAMPKTIQ
jgi:hypothetical protein